MVTEGVCGSALFASKFMLIIPLISSTSSLIKINVGDNNYTLLLIFILYRKPAPFEGLEIDQYVWSVLQNKQTVEFDEVTIDQNAKFKPCLPTILKVIRVAEF